MNPEDFKFGVQIAFLVLITPLVSVGLTMAILIGVAALTGAL